MSQLDGTQPKVRALTDLLEQEVSREDLQYLSGQADARDCLVKEYSNYVGKMPTHHATLATYRSSKIIKAKNMLGQSTV